VATLTARAAQAEAEVLHHSNIPE